MEKKHCMKVLKYILKNWMNNQYSTNWPINWSLQIKQNNIVWLQHRKQNRKQNSREKQIGTKSKGKKNKNLIQKTEDSR